ncbi:hypothetical protein EDD27_7676 [Nonomuraea polychroma]|uniref:DUF3558 domain-containing protein n=1 Tax=Nonomuraea polychroma TaxID=46176 RepID=A0A438MGE3_9ACTN|nr:hypothetical protein [Nonomuraea polychroma]RVX44909.1 hypothetical protein EDD27_7676 [Nonomuraea polychroma]
MAIWESTSTDMKPPTVRHIAGTGTGLVLIFAMVTGCTGTGSPSSPSPDNKTIASPVTDAPPYWCDFLPQQAVRTISGLTLPLQEDKSGVPATHGICTLRNEYTRLSVVWSVRDGDSTMDLARKNFGEHQLAALPADLGTGLIAYTGRLPRTNPYYTMMLFRCGAQRPWISVDLSEVAKGRDPVSDLTQLLSIARNRYGELHKCTPKPN